MERRRSDWAAGLFNLGVFTGKPILKLNIYVKWVHGSNALCYRSRRRAQSDLGDLGSGEANEENLPHAHTLRFAQMAHLFQQVFEQAPLLHI